MKISMYITNQHAIWIGFYIFELKETIHPWLPISMPSQGFFKVVYFRYLLIDIDMIPFWYEKCITSYHRLPNIIQDKYRHFPFQVTFVFLLSIPSRVYSCILPNAQYFLLLTTSHSATGWLLTTYVAQAGFKLTDNPLASAFQILKLEILTVTYSDNSALRKKWSLCYMLLNFWFRAHAE